MDDADIDSREVGRWSRAVTEAESAAIEAFNADPEQQDASMGARIAREATAANERIRELRAQRASINNQIKDNLAEYGRLRRAAKLWEHEP